MNYEKPLLIDFSPGDRAEGTPNCKTGASASVRCSLGSGVGGIPTGKCRNGSSATGRCQSGASALSGCSLGSRAT